MLYFAKRITEDLKGAKIYLKREDLNHTGAHKINNVLGQVLLAKKWEKKSNSGNGSGTAWSGNGDYSGAYGYGMRNIYGKRRYRKTGFKCL